MAPGRRRKRAIPRAANASSAAKPRHHDPDFADMLIGSAVRRGLFHRSRPRPFHGDDEPKTLRYANYSNCPMGADGEHPWENGYCESFNGKLRDELLNGEIFYSLKEARIVAEKWRKHDKEKRPHSSLGYRPPAPATFGKIQPPNRSPRYSNLSLGLVQKLGQAPAINRQGLVLFSIFGRSGGIRTPRGDA